MRRNIRKGDIVGRKSYGKDIFFVVDKIIKTSNRTFCMLKGLTVRIEADSPLEDLELITRQEALSRVKELDTKLYDRIDKALNRARQTRDSIYHTGKILHLDGDRRYSNKSAKYYKSLGLDAIVKNIPENRQPFQVRSLLERYKPDILVITGHDAMLKNGRNYNDIYNYRNSRYFIATVQEARKWRQDGNELVIFAGACQSFFEAIMSSGANFASSPARVLIDFIDPLIVAEKVATTEQYRYISINEIAVDLRDGLNGVGGTGAMGKKR